MAVFPRRCCDLSMRLFHIPTRLKIPLVRTNNVVIARNGSQIGRRLLATLFRDEMFLIFPVSDMVFGRAGTTKSFII